MKVIICLLEDLVRTDWKVEERFCTTQRPGFIVLGSELKKVQSNQQRSNGWLLHKARADRQQGRQRLHQQEHKYAVFKSKVGPLAAVRSKLSGYCSSWIVEAGQQGSQGPQPTGQ